MLALSSSGDSFAVLAKEFRRGIDRSSFGGGSYGKARHGRAVSSIRPNATNG